MRIWVIFVVATLCGCTGLNNPEVMSPPIGIERAVVFDIDGTLTPNVGDIYVARKKAAKTVRAFADQHYQIFYISARTRMFQSMMPGWLKKNKFPAGAIFVPQTMHDAKDPAGFKTRVLHNLQTKGWRIEFAFGDSTTDFDAYANVGIPREHVFALQRKSAASCQPGAWKMCLRDWSDFINPTTSTAP